MSMGEQEAKRKIYDAEASKKAILDAGEALFAAKGFEATSIQEISARAGVSRGTPGYFFGSKDQLYQAVLERALRIPADIINRLRVYAGQPGASARDVMRTAIDEYIDWLAINPHIVRIISWEELRSGGGYLGEMPGFLAVLQELLATVREELGWQGDARQFIIDVLALCYFPMAYTQTLKSLDLNVHDPEFLTQRKQHVLRHLLGEDPSVSQA